MQIANDIFSIVHQYDVLFVDMYGVLYGGVGLLDGVLETLEKIKKGFGKKIVIVSNTTQTSAEAQHSYEKYGMFGGLHYDLFITSGELLKHELNSNFLAFSSLFPSKVRAITSLFQWNDAVFQNNPLAKVDSYDDADIIYVGVPKVANNRIGIKDFRDKNGNAIRLEDLVNADWKIIKNSAGKCELAELAELLEDFLRKNKVLLVANPDIFAHGILGDASVRVPLITQGCIGRYYEKLGGKVVYLGKPYRRIFEFAIGCASEKFGNSSWKIAMVGDTPWTDVLGANISGIDSIMTLTGIAEEFFAIAPSHLSETDKIDAFFSEIAIKLVEMSSSKLQQKCRSSECRYGHSNDVGGNVRPSGELYQPVDNDQQNVAQMVFPRYIIRRFAPISN
ncbi:MAG: HAD hydrolase-like protein [Holosporaceae bacterium]|nr:HAD hydrolase-like protein [Holosporaceae bacterium]